MSFDADFWLLKPNGNLDPYKLGYWIMLAAAVAYGLHSLALF